ncbi:MAG: hypothetical protein P9L94_02820 [Candidatus Hinthialibacter antarcticus]|nr:hypothetical protein [Candidatus Hinthialibacter antarcticus]
MTSNPQTTPEAKPETKSPPSPSGLTGKGYASGLLMTGVVIVGSWMGMAAYIDYRLQDVEKHLANNRETIVAQVKEETQNARDTLVLQTSKNSSILAQGILEITDNTNQGFKNTKEALTAYQSSMNESQQSTATALKQDIEAARQAVIEELSSSQQKISKSLVAQWDKTQTVQSQALETALGNLQSSQDKSTGKILAAVDTVGSEVKGAKSAINESLNSSMKSLQDLVKNGNINQREQFTQLLASLGGINEQTVGTNETIGNQLQGLAEQVSVLHQNMKTTQGSLDQVQAFMPEIRKTYETQWAEWVKYSDENVGQLASNISEIHGRINEMNKGLEAASDSMMNALYVNSQGLEGTRVDLKSDLVISHEETSAQLQDLSQSLQAISSELKTLQTKVNDPDNSAIGFNGDESKKHVETLKTAMSEFSKTLGGVRDNLTTALLPGLKQLEQSSNDESVKESVQLLKKAVDDVETLISTTEQQRNSIEASLQRGGAIALEDSALSESSTQVHSAENQTETIEQHPEHRTEHALGFRLY